MTTYFVVLSAICLLALWSVFLPPRMRLYQNLISFVGYGGMCIFVGLRDHIGADWNSYNEIFGRISSSSLFSSLFLVEPLYLLCNLLTNLVGGDIHLVNLICAMILLGSLYKFSCLVEIDSNLILFISTPYLLFVVGMGYTRQSVAVGLGLAAIGYLRIDRKNMFYIFAGLATLFHISALFLILIYWMNSYKRIALVVAACIAASPVLLVLLSSQRYIHYLDNNPDMQSRGVWSRILLMLAGLAFMHLQKRRWKEDPKLQKVIFRAAVALGLMIIVSLFLSTLADRFCLYLFFLYIVGVGSLIRYSKLSLRYLTLFFLICLTYSSFVAWFGFSTYAAAAWFPYRNALFNGI